MDTGPFYRFEPERPVRYQRDVQSVTAVECFDIWNNPPTKAYVHFQSIGFDDMSGLIKIQERKNGSHYVVFCGKRYDIDVTCGNKMQFVRRENHGTL